MKILVLGASGMLGSSMFRLLDGSTDHHVVGTLRSSAARRFFPGTQAAQLPTGVDVLDQDTLVRLFADVQPDVVVNCIGLVKQLADANSPMHALPVNALLPHRLAELAAVAGARVVHISTDCVFAGSRGSYSEDDVADATDLYGRSKHMGELVDRAHCITLRTSIIGHELASAHSLVDWFLSQQGRVRGFTRAVFSGLPTVELARVVRDQVLPEPGLHGLFHVAAEPINKHDLLTLVATTYGVDTQIDPDDALVIDRSLDGSRFRAATGWQAAPWPELVARMHADRPADHFSR